MKNKFTQELKNFEKGPPAEAWDKIQSQLNKTQSKRKVLWWPKAAVIILLCLSSFFLINETLKLSRTADNGKEARLTSSDPTTMPEVEGKDLLPKNQEVGGIADNKGDINRQAPKAESTIEKTESHKAKLITSVPLKAKPKKAGNEAMQNDTLEKHIENESKVVPAYMADIDILSTEKENLLSGTKKTTPSVTIEYISGRPEQPVFVAEKEESNQSIFIKKFFNKVKDAQSGELGLGTIREAKDELFALELQKIKNTVKSEKQ